MKSLFAILTALAAAVTVVPAQAAPITFTFSGNVTYDYFGGPTGQAASGSVTVDTSTFQYANSNGTSYNVQQGYYYNSSFCPSCTLQTNPLQVTGHYSDGSKQVNVGGGSAYDEGHVDVYRNDGGYNRAVVFGYSADITGDTWQIELFIYDYLGSASEIFTDPNGGVDVNQGINWAATGATVTFYAQHTNNAGVVSYQQGQVTSVTTDNQVPEPATLALVSGALLGAGWAARRSAARRIPA